LSLRTHVETLAGSIGERNLWRYASLQRAAEYIATNFLEMDYEPLLHRFEVSKLPLTNIEVVLAGDPSSRENVVVGSHYDTVPYCPGANDNATGVAAMLELARRFRERRCRHTLRFVAFVNEEPPFFQTPQMGSVVYANAARASGMRIAGMLSLETIGYYSDAPGSQRYPVPMAPMYPDTGNFIGLVSNLASVRLLLRARRAFRAASSFPLQSAALPGAVPGVGWSDHWAFWEAGYPALMVTDTAPYRYPWYHTPDDTPDKICYPAFEQVVNGLEHVIQALAE
jgi:Zn-dependent M28 family amino/carboxypeptidase